MTVSDPSTVSAPAHDPLRRLARAITGPLGALASLSTIVMMVAIVIDVVSRNIGQSSVPGLVEMSESALVATVFLGLAYAGATNAHVAVDLFTDAMPAGLARLATLTMWILGVGITAWFVVGSMQRALASTRSNELRAGLVDWPLWPSRWLITIGLIAFLIVAVINVILLLRKQPLLGQEIVTDPAAGTLASPNGTAGDATALGNTRTRADDTPENPRDGGDR